MTDDTVRDAAIEAAAKVWHEALGLTTPWENVPPGVQQYDRNKVTPLVDAVLAVAEPAWRKTAFELRKTAIAEARAEALEDAEEQR